MSVLRRYEILLPLQFNRGEQVPESLVAETILELRDRFGAVSCETSVIQGEWEDGGVIYRDRLVRVFIDVPDTQENRQFFVGFKERLKERFQQLEIWLTTFPIELI
jgi:hypothetical protein